MPFQVRRRNSCQILVDEREVIPKGRHEMCTHRFDQPHRSDKKNREKPFLRTECLGMFGELATETEILRIDTLLKSIALRSMRQPATALRSMTVLLSFPLGGIDLETLFGKLGKIA
jgi:hypothetical protein